MKGLQRVWFGEGGKITYFRYPIKSSFGGCFARKASLRKIGNKPAETTWCMLEGIGRNIPKVLPFKGRERERERDTQLKEWVRVCHGVGNGRKRKWCTYSECSGGWTLTAKKVMGTFERCLQQTKIVSEQCGQKGEITWVWFSI